MPSALTALNNFTFSILVRRENVYIYFSIFIAQKKATRTRRAGDRFGSIKETKPMCVYANNIKVAGCNWMTARETEGQLEGQYLAATVWCLADYWARSQWPASACTRRNTYDRRGSRLASSCSSSPEAWLSAASCTARCAQATWCRDDGTSSASPRAPSRRRPSSSQLGAGSAAAC